ARSRPSPFRRTAGWWPPPAWTGPSSCGTCRIGRGSWATVEAGPTGLELSFDTWRCAGQQEYVGSFRFETPAVITCLAAGDDGPRAGDCFVSQGNPPMSRRTRWPLAAVAAMAVAILATLVLWPGDRD